MIPDFAATMLDRLARARHVAVFTGAGVSEESGIPTFRDALTGLWRSYDAENLATPQAFARDRELVWGWYEWRRMRTLNCQPNAAHRALAAMEKHVPRCSVITQNVDDLHERAGSGDVIHLHGSLHDPRCEACGRRFELSAKMPEEPEGGRRLPPPRCRHCGGWIRPGVVWFGESLPDAQWRAAAQVVSECDVLFSIGTSAVVYPAAALPFEAARRGACVIQVNPQPTGLDEAADYTLRGKAGKVMPALIAATWES